MSKLKHIIVEVMGAIEQERLAMEAEDLVNALDEVLGKLEPNFRNKCEKAGFKVEIDDAVRYANALMGELEELASKLAQEGDEDE